MQRACWQDESEVFGEDDVPYVPHKRTVAPWEAHSLTSQELREEDEKHIQAAGVKVKHIWADPSEADLQAQFDKQLEALDYQMKTPWDQVRPGDDVAKMKAEAQAVHDRNSSYKYEALWSEQQMTASQLEQLACYEMKAPFEMEGDTPQNDPKFEAKKAMIAAKIPRTLAPWKYGQEPAPPRKEKEFHGKLDTTPWLDLEPKKPAASKSSLPSSGDPVLDATREKLLSRTHDIAGLAKRFKIMDDDRSGSLDFNEFRKGMKECQVGITDMQIKHIFQFFDKDDSGYVDYEEFLVGLRGQLNPHRMALVRVAFKRLDRDGNGYIDIEDIKQCYNARGHPDVIQHFRTEEEVLSEVLDAFDGGVVRITADSGDKNGAKGTINKKGDGVVTLQEFCDYYANISASIDSDDYFELMVRNAWHISGGSGWAANTTNVRTLVTHADGTQTVEEQTGDPMSIDYSKSFGAAGDSGANTRGRQLMHMNDDSSKASRGMVGSLRGAIAKQQQQQDGPHSARSAGKTTQSLNSRHPHVPAPQSARRHSGSSTHSHHSVPTRSSPNTAASLAAGPNANHTDVPPHRPGRQLPAPGTGHIRGLPDQASWTTTPGSAALTSNRVLKDIQNSQNTVPGTLAAALASKQPMTQAHAQAQQNEQPMTELQHQEYTEYLRQQQAQRNSRQGQIPQDSSLAAALAGNPNQTGVRPLGPPPRAVPHRGATPPTFSKGQLEAAAARNKKSGAPKSLREQLMAGK